jgi:hypothetical protein
MQARTRRPAVYNRLGEGAKSATIRSSEASEDRAGSIAAMAA